MFHYSIFLDLLWEIDLPHSSWACLLYQALIDKVKCTAFELKRILPPVSII